jgi:hypothetical protein
MVASLQFISIVHKEIELLFLITMNL